MTPQPQPQPQPQQAILRRIDSLRQCLATLGVRETPHNVSALMEFLTREIRSMWEEAQLPMNNPFTHRANTKGMKNLD